MAPKKSSGLHQKAAGKSAAAAAASSDAAVAPIPPTDAAAAAPPPPSPPPAAAQSEVESKQQGVVFQSGGGGKKAAQGSSAAAAAATLPQQQQQQQQQRAKGGKPQIGFVPPGALTGGSGDRRNHFENGFEEHFHVPQRIATAPVQLVEAVNDFHFAMMNDLPRNDFYWSMLKQHIVPGETRVLEIGAGSGLLSMMAAKLGAKWVVAVEGSAEMARLAANNVKANNFSDTVKVLNLMSTDLQLKHLPGTPDLLVSEIFGTMLLGESAHDYIADIRDRILTPSNRGGSGKGKGPAKQPSPDAARPVTILPRFGTQYAVLIECPTLDSICSVGSWNGLDLREVNALRDTASTVFTKKYGFRMSSVEYKELCAPIPLIEIDFNTVKSSEESGAGGNSRAALHRELKIAATESGVAHAVMFFWTAWHPAATASGDGEEEKAVDGSAGKKHVMSTNPRDTVDNFPRDMQWGQALQLLDSCDADVPSARPVPFVVEKGCEYRATLCRSLDNVILQLDVRGCGKAAATAAAAAAEA